MEEKAGGPMSTPLRDAVEGYLKTNRARLHMPGHKGTPLFPVGEAARWDITEVEGADSLYEAGGAIAEMERRYAALYGAASSLASAGGSTLCIQAMLAAACPPGSQVVAARGAHTAAVNAMALLGLEPVWVWPRPDPELGGMAPVSPRQVEAALREHPGAAAVYVTSPNYFGLLSDIPALSALCARRGIPLLVDNAHGAHLRFLRPSLHPMDQGADLCCDSLHKTLPVLTGGALLHIARPGRTGDVKGRMALFGSTSPSYLILLSMDGALPYLEERAGGDLARVAERVKSLEALAERAGFAVPALPRDPARLTVGFGAAGCTKEDFARHVRRAGVEPEYLGERFGVFLTAPRNRERDYRRLEALLARAGGGRALPCGERAFAPPVKVCSLREAALGNREEIPVEEAAGRTAGSVAAPCPPGIPLVVPGERIDGDLIILLKSAGFVRVNVLK